jgi:hypothetical protein
MEVPTSELIAAMSKLMTATPVIAEPVSDAPEAVARPGRRRSAVEGMADIDHSQLDGSF